MGISITAIILIIMAIIKWYVSRPPKVVSSYFTKPTSNESQVDSNAYFENSSDREFGIDIFGMRYNIIKLHYCSVRCRLSVLNYKKDGAYYVTIIDDLNNKVENEFKLNLSFSLGIINSIAPDNWGRVVGDKYPDYDPMDRLYGINDNVSREFRTLFDLKFFKVDFDKNRIILFGQVFNDTFKNSKISRSGNNNEYSFEIHNFQGKLEFQKTMVCDELEDMIYCDGKLLIRNDASQHNLQVYSYETDQSSFFDLTDDDEDLETKDFYYEYLESMRSSNETDLFGFIGKNATYGAQGIKIMHIRGTETLELNYDLYDLDTEGNFQNLAFNYSSDEFAVLAYHYPENFDILVYSLSNAEKKPLKVIKTIYRHDDDYFTYSQYFSNEKLAIIKSDRIAIYNLKSGSLEKQIARDLVSSYFISENLIWYCFEGKLKMYRNSGS